MDPSVCAHITYSAAAHQDQGTDLRHFSSQWWTAATAPQINRCVCVYPVLALEMSANRFWEHCVLLNTISLMDNHEKKYTLGFSSFSVSTSTFCLFLWSLFSACASVSLLHSQFFSFARFSNHHHNICTTVTVHFSKRIVQTATPPVSKVNLHVSEHLSASENSLRHCLQRR